MPTHVLHRTIKAFIPNVPDEELDQYPVEDWIHGPNIAPVIGVPHALWVLEGERLRPMNASEIAARDEAIALADAKAAHKKKVDLESSKSIASGFEYDGRMFSLSINAQMNIANLFLGRDRQSYPVPYTTIDDSEIYWLPDTAAVEAFYDAARAKIRATLAAGAERKKQIHDAATIDEIQQIQDRKES